MKKIFENLWYHYKAAIIVSVLVLAAGAYMLAQSLGVTVPDYRAAIISSGSCSDEQLERLKNVLESAGTDRNSDGQVSAEIKFYQLSLGESGQNINALGALDADLVGNVSGLFLLEDPAAFESATNGIICEADCVPAGETEALSGLGLDDLYAAVRPGNAEEDFFRELIF